MPRKLQDGTQEFSQTMGALNAAAKGAGEDVARGKSLGVSKPVSKKQANDANKTKYKTEREEYKQNKKNRRKAKVINKIGGAVTVPAKTQKPSKPKKIK